MVDFVPFTSLLAGDNNSQYTANVVILSRPGGRVDVNSNIYVDSSGNIGIGTNAPANKLDINGAVAFRSGFNVAGTAVVASLVTNTNAFSTTLSTSGQATLASLVSNTNIFSATLNTSGQATLASAVVNANITTTTINSTGQSTVASAVVNANITTATLNVRTSALVATINSNSSVVGVNLQSTGQASVASLVSNGAVSGTTGTFSTSLYGAAFNTAGTATVNALASNGAVSGTTGTFSTSLYGAAFNTAGTATVNALVSNTYGSFGQNVVVRSGNISNSTSSGALVVSGGVGIGGNLNVGGNTTITGNLVVTGAIIGALTAELPLVLNDVSSQTDGVRAVFGLKTNQTYYTGVVDSKNLEVIVDGNRLSPYVQQICYPWLCNYYGSWPGYRVRGGNVTIYNAPDKGSRVSLTVVNKSATQQTQRYPYLPTTIVLGD